MLDKISHIKAGEKEYPIAFTLNVMEAIQERYGNMKKWGEALQLGDEEPSIKDLKWTFAQLVNEGIDIENEEKGEKRPFVTEKHIGRLISRVGIDQISKTIQELTIKSVRTGDEDPNLKTVQNQTNQQ